MIVLPKWLKEEAEAQRLMRLRQRRVTSDEAQEQFKRVQLESTTNTASKAQKSRDVIRRYCSNLAALGASLSRTWPPVAKPKPKTRQGHAKPV